MKWNMLLGALAVSVGLCSQSFGATLLDRMLGTGCGCNSCCETAPSCCAAAEPSCCAKAEPSCCAPAAAEPSCCAPAAPTCEAAPSCCAAPSCGCESAPSCGCGCCCTERNCGSGRQAERQRNLK